jgi:F-type H+-transporting ATPase subunit a
MYFLSNIPEIKLNSDVLFNIGPAGITSSMLATWLCMFIIIGFALYVRKGLGLVPTKAQLIIEETMGFFEEKLETAFGSKEEARKYIPYIITMFLLFFVANQFSIIPIISSITTEGGSLFRTPTADFSLPIAVALLTVGISHVMALSIAPIKHIGGFITFWKLGTIRKISDIPSVFLEIFLGTLDIIGEIAKVVSLSARLFGNVVAGELMVIIITYLATFTNFIVPMPFIFLSIFSGVIQAFVFPLLAIQYIGGSVTAVRESN